MRKLERLKCRQCSARLGEKGKGGHITYTQPLICPQCSTDNTAHMREAIIGQASATTAADATQTPQPQPKNGPQASSEAPQQPQNPPQLPPDRFEAFTGQQQQTSEEPARIPGTPLENPRHEAFCRNFALGKCSATRAYRDAGFEADDAGARVNASRLLTNANVLSRISELQAELARKAVEVEHWSREERITRLQRRATQLDEVIAARAAEVENWQAPGGHTGHIVRTFKAAGGMIVDEYSVDVALLKELRAIEQQIAQELGEWLTKTAVDLRSDIPTFEVPENASIEDIRAAKAKMLEAMAAFSGNKQPEAVQ